MYVASNLLGKTVNNYDKEKAWKEVVVTHLRAAYKIAKKYQIKAQTIFLKPQIF
jgi:DNA-directed RNA polymerase sigma subunit (sigma70/sigma32)